MYAFNYDHVGTALSAIHEIGYSTYRSAGNDQQVPALNLEVDVNGAAPGGFTTLVFEPVYNTTQGAVVSGQWQTWDAYNGDVVANVAEIADTAWATPTECSSSPCR